MSEIASVSRLLLSTLWDKFRLREPTYPIVHGEDITLLIFTIGENRVPRVKSQSGPMTFKSRGPTRNSGLSINVFFISFSVF